MTITLINSFIVPEEKAEEFLEVWRAEIDHFRSQPGFLETKLHRNTGLKDQTFLYVNVALWENVDAYPAAFKGYVPAGQRVPGVTAHPGLFEVCIAVCGTSGA